MNRRFVDQMGFALELDYVPKRIISLVPSITELLFDLNLGNDVVAVTNFCIYPKDKVQFLPKIGGTKNINFEAVQAVKPDLIIGNKEENTIQDIEKLKSNFPVWMSDINNLDQAVETIKEIGKITNKEPEASYLNYLIEAGFNDLKELAKQEKRKKVCYCIWKEPYMAASTETYINSILEIIGFENVMKESRYPAFDIDYLNKIDCDYLFLSTEPYPFTQKHVDKIQKLLTHTQVVLVDGEMFSWYGSRMVKSIEYFFHLQKRLFSK